MALNPNAIKNAVALYKSTQPNRFKFPSDMAESDVDIIANKMATNVSRSIITAVLKDGNKGFIITNGKLYMSPEYKCVKSEIVYRDILNVKKDSDSLEILSFEEGWQKIYSKEYTNDLFDLFSKIMEYSNITPRETWKGNAPGVTDTAKIKKEIHLMPDFGFVYKCNAFADDRLFRITERFYIGRDRNNFQVCFIDDHEVKIMNGGNHLLPGIFREGYEFEVVKGVFKDCLYLGNYRCLEESTGYYFTIEFKEKSTLDYHLQSENFIKRLKLFCYNGKNYLFSITEYHRDKE